MYLVSTAQPSGNKATLVDCGGSRPNITWMYGAVKIRLVNICEMKEDQLQEILAKHEDIFKPELGKLQGFQAKLHVQEGVTPNSTKPDQYCTR